eukprot:c17448_g1_i1.p1 GENE.c17448_g1_i1~~c17448_g1_i1.p1  ORF type:complete len:420 (-),score=83.02 c17448_g1_i1:41-1300(-)
MLNKVLTVLALCASVQAQLDRKATEYPIEAQGKPPLTSSVLFVTNDLDADRRNALPPATLVVGVMTAPHHFDEREAVRSTWMQFQSLTDPKLNNLSVEEKQGIIVRFIIGTPSSATLEPLLVQESLKYHDIVRVPVLESYFNLTLKTGEFLKWADATFNYKWAMKCDDDSFVRIDSLLEDLKTRPSEKFYMGKMWTGTPVDRRVDKHTPWHEHHRFAAGAGYVLSHDLVRFIVRNYDALFKFPLEDVAVGAWIAALDVNYVDHPHFHSLPEGCDRNMIVQNPASLQVMRETFYNSVKGIPCHATPDPFDPKNKNITDHVLLELGIPKTETKKDHMQRVAGVQNMLSMDTDDDALEQQIPESADDMPSSVMNGNMPSQNAVFDMNNVQGMNENNDGLEQMSLSAVDRMNSKVLGASDNVI